MCSSGLCRPIWSTWRQIQTVTPPLPSATHFVYFPNSVLTQPSLKMNITSSSRITVCAIRGFFRLQGLLFHKTQTKNGKNHIFWDVKQFRLVHCYRHFEGFYPKPVQSSICHTHFLPNSFLHPPPLPIYAWSSKYTNLFKVLRIKFLHAFLTYPIRATCHVHLIRRHRRSNVTVDISRQEGKRSTENMQAWQETVDERNWGKNCTM